MKSLRQRVDGDEKRDTEISSEITAAPPPNALAVGWRRLVGWLMPRNARTEAMATSVHFHASPEAVWQRMLMYEEVPGRPPLLLRALLPQSVRAEGDKTRVGAHLKCTYVGGHLVKCIRAVEPPHRLEFDVIEQRLGIEAWVTLLSGSYEMRCRGDETEIVLTTKYRGRLRPRLIWRFIEGYLAHQLHYHILSGMRAALTGLTASSVSVIAKSPIPKSISP